MSSCLRLSNLKGNSFEEMRREESIKERVKSCREEYFVQDIQVLLLFNAAHISEGIFSS